MAENCRVMQPHPCNSRGANTWGLGFHSYINPAGGVLQFENGMTVYKPGEGLKPYQRRDFLEPEFYDSGCYGIYCPRKDVCPAGELAGPSAETTAMFDSMFASSDPYQGNNGPANCAGVKGATYNSFLGWEVPPGGSKPLWEA